MKTGFILLNIITVIDGELALKSNKEFNSRSVIKGLMGVKLYKSQCILSIFLFVSSVCLMKLFGTENPIEASDK